MSKNTRYIALLLLGLGCLNLASCQDLNLIPTDPSAQTTEQTPSFNSADAMLENFVSTGLDEVIETYKGYPPSTIEPELNRATNQLFIDANQNSLDDVLSLKSKPKLYDSATVINETTRIIKVDTLSVLYKRLKTQSGNDAYLSASRGSEKYSFSVPQSGSVGLLNLDPQAQTIEILMQVAEGREIGNTEKLILKPSVNGWE